MGSAGISRENAGERGGGMRKSVSKGVCAAGFILFLMLFLSSCATTDTAGRTDITTSEPGAAAETVTVEQQSKEQQEAAIMAEPGKQWQTKDQKLLDAINGFQIEKIYFDYDKYDLSSESRNVLSNKAQWLKANTGFKVRIEGNCDERGTNEYNLALGERRAQAAFNFLVTVGVPAERISTISFGEEKPFDPGHDEEAWAKNRRDEFVLSE